MADWCGDNNNKKLMKGNFAIGGEIGEKDLLKESLEYQAVTARSPSADFDAQK